MLGEKETVVALSNKLDQEIEVVFHNKILTKLVNKSNRKSNIRKDRKSSLHRCKIDLTQGKCNTDRL